MALINSIISWFNIKRISKIELMEKFPEEVQIETFIELIQAAKDTEWGKEHKYKTIDSIDDFKNQVPIQEYDDIKPYINKLRNGERNILWPGDIKWFAKSSGTTNDKSKFIPVSEESLEDCHFRGGKDIIAIYSSIFPDNGILKGKTLVLGGSHQIDNFNNNSYFGDLSAVMIENLPFWAKFLRAPSQEVALLSDWEEKIEKMANEAIQEDITSIAGVPSWTLVLLKYILEKTGKDNLLDVWPNLELFIHGGVSFKPYKKQFDKLISGRKLRYLETYNASEGFFAIQNDLDSDDMMLMLDYGVFYEFQEINEYLKKSNKTLTIGEVELNKNYAIIITTNGGLWRYIIGDTVMFTNKHPYKIKITGRLKHFINTFGEELIIDNADKAIEIAAKKTNCEIKEYTAAPIFPSDSSLGGHEWIFEFAKTPENISFFADILDNALKSLNSDYEAKRYKNMTIAFPKIHVAKQDLFYDWMKNRGKLGGQNKVPRLANNRIYIDELIELNNK